MKLKALYIRYRLVLCVARRAVQVWMSFYRFLQMNFPCLSEYLPLFFTGLAEIVNGILNDKLTEQKLQEVQSQYVRPENCSNLVAPKVNKQI